MRVPRKAPGQAVQMMLLEAALERPVVLSQDQNRELESALAQLLLSTLQLSGQSESKGGDDAVEDHA
jgi:hypothetical protein